MQTHFKSLQRIFRKNMPLSEVILWQNIRKKQLGIKFRRQYTIGNRILDFYAPEIKLGIEIDGDTHYWNSSTHQREIEKDKRLERQGIKIMRFLNPEVKDNLDGVLMKIKEEIEHKTLDIKGGTPKT